MLDIIQSNRLEILAERLCADLERSPLASPLAKEIIVVQDMSVGRWLELFIARTSGIAANIRFLNPGQFIGDLYRGIEPSLRSGSPYDPGRLQWRIFGVLGDQKFLEAYPELKRFLTGGDSGRRFDLASRIAEMLDRYLIYRMDWIEDWEKKKEGKRGRDEVWEAALWREATRTIDCPHHGQLHRRLHGMLETGEVRLPERVSVFGIGSLSPAYAALLRAAGTHAAVRMYVMNPCSEMWSDIADRRTIADLEYTPDLLHFDLPHTLLGSFGKQGRDFMSIVYEAEGEGTGAANLFEAQPEDSLLHSIQNGILHLTETGFAFDSNDTSLQIQSCHTQMREVQVMRDRLLDMLQEDSTLRAADIIVLAPDINVYAPYIDAVFSMSAKGEPAIPYEIADRIPAQVEPVAEAWLALMDMRKSRFEADTVIGLLRLAPIADAFGIVSDEVDRIAGWVEKSGIRWGIDGRQKESLGLPRDDHFTWSWGLDRMILGVALPRSAAGDAEPLFHGYLPSDTIEGRDVDLLGRFAGFVAVLKEWVEYLKQPRTMEQWGSTLDIWLDRFFPMGKEIAEQREEIREIVQGMVVDCLAAGYDGTVEYPVIAKIVEGGLGNDRRGLRLHSGGVVFCSMKPMRALPSRVVYLLGMADGQFPRDRRTPSFDLTRKYYRHGDRSGRLDDRYLFLELLLSARDKLVMSYVGEDVQTGKKLPPSPVMSEFLDFVGQIAFRKSIKGSDELTPRERTEQALLIRHPLQAFSPRYFDESDPRLFSYSTDSCRTSEAIRSGQAEESGVFPVPLPPLAAPARRIRLDDLCAFFMNPTRFLYNRRLNIYYRDEDSTLEGLEPLVVGKAENRGIAKALMDYMRSGKPVDDAGWEGLFNRLSADGALPSGLPGAIGFNAAVGEMTPVLEEYGELLSREKIGSIAGTVRIGEWDLEVEFTYGLTTSGYFEGKPNKLKGKDFIQFWMKTLGIALVHPNRETGMLIGSLLGVGQDYKKAIKADRRDFQQPKNPAAILQKLLTWYEEGMRRPIHFFPESAWAFAEGYGEDANVDAAMKKAVAAWMPNDAGFGFPEANDEYYRRVFAPDETALDKEFRGLATLITVSALSGVLAPEKPKKTRRARS